MLLIGSDMINQNPLVPAKAETQFSLLDLLDSRFRGNERGADSPGSLHEF